jgi:hypothetical protein
VLRRSGFSIDLTVVNLPTKRMASSEFGNATAKGPVPSSDSAFLLFDNRCYHYQSILIFRFEGHLQSDEKLIVE